LSSIIPMSEKILLITQVFYPDEVSTANLFTNLCSILVEEHVDVEVWCSQPSYTVLKKQPKSIILNGIKIFFLPSTNYKKTNLLGRLTNYFSFTISVVIKLIFSREKTPVFTHTTPPTLGIIISFICSFKKRKFIYVLLDIFPEGLVRLGNMSKNNVFVRFWQYLFIISLKKSEKIIVIGRDMKKWTEDIYPQADNKTEYIPLWQDEKLIFPQDYGRNTFVIENKLTDKFVIQYSGNMGLWNEMSTMGKAVRENLKDVVFLFVGGGMRKKELLEAISDENMKNVMILPFQPNDSFNTILSACHVGLVTMRDNLEGMAVPSKIYGIMAAGKPIIALVPLNSEIAYIVTEENCGFVVKPGDIVEFIRVICLLKKDENLRIRMGQNSRLAFEEKYSTRKIAGRYKLLIEKLNEV
jgi:colanic acid biosynthesis glycosyl transferase WcaI